MRPDGVVMASPSFDQDLCLSQGVEDLPVQELVAQAAAEGLAVAILPWAAGCDVEHLHTDPRQPLLHGVGDKLRAVVGPYMRRRPTGDEQFSQRCQYVFTF